MNRVFLLTGGNLGEKRSNLLKAADLIEKKVGEIIRRSSLYETEAWGKTDQPAFLNQVLEIETPVSAQAVLDSILSIEEEMGRFRQEKYGPRIIDIDILFYNDEQYRLPQLTVPHPRIQDRRFVLEPLAEIAPELAHPVLKLSIQELLDQCFDTLAVRKLPEL
ncbi:MAG TPA: 2-amino-4-hydroxy-6-hydroxymethyldihydropteridine diphosphokinase [Parasegetibacter sp.]